MCYQPFETFCVAVKVDMVTDCPDLEKSARQSVCGSVWQRAAAEYSSAGDAAARRARSCAAPCTKPQTTVLPGLDRLRLFVCLSVNITNT